MIILIIRWLAGRLGFFLHNGRIYSHFSGYSGCCYVIACHSWPGFVTPCDFPCGIKVVNKAILFFHVLCFARPPCFQPGKPIIGSENKECATRMPAINPDRDGWAGLRYMAASVYRQEIWQGCWLWRHRSGCKCPGSG